MCSSLRKRSRGVLKIAKENNFTSILLFWDIYNASCIFTKMLLFHDHLWMPKEVSSCPSQRITIKSLPYFPSCYFLSIVFHKIESIQERRREYSSSGRKTFVFRHVTTMAGWTACASGNAGAFPYFVNCPSVLTTWWYLKFIPIVIQRIIISFLCLFMSSCFFHCNCYCYSSDFFRILSKFNFIMHGSRYILREPSVLRCLA